MHRSLLFSLSLVLWALPALCEIPDSPKNQALDQADRFQKAKLGSRVADWARHLEDKDPELRFEAVKLIGESEDPQASQYLVGAVESSDPRVAAAAVDYLGRMKAKDAAGFLSERLFLAGTSATIRQHVLVALGRIGDEGSSRRVLDFVQAESDANLRGTAVRVLGEIGSPSIATDLQKLSEQERDPKQKTLMQDAVAKIAARASDAVAHHPPSSAE